MQQKHIQMIFHENRVNRLI